ncbi:MAG: NAD-dependent epimerase/dehydratase family protein [Chloroflexota bacterium]|nr:NAD-dependent epimerase/dehydratase family protein [Chloroflexota bacterium]
MRVLITGSSGQIGTNLALRLMEEGHSVFGVDKRANTWTDRFRYLLQDLSSPYPPYEQGIGGVEYPPVDLVVHLAAHAKVHELVRHPHRAMENISMTYNVLEYCRLARLPIIFSSSREVYGDIRRYIEDEADKPKSMSEGTAHFAYTESPYSASKIASEALIYSYARCYGLQYIVFRFSNVYGRYDNDIQRMERVIPLFIERIARGEPITIFGENKILDFTYVDDCVTGITAGVNALYQGRVVNQTINLAYGQGNTLVKMAQLIGEALGTEPKITLAPALLGEVTHYVADITKARELLDYNPGVSLQEGIPRAVAWNQQWGN